MNLTSSNLADETTPLSEERAANINLPSSIPLIKVRVYH
jgi:hypothetical protein